MPFGCSELSAADREWIATRLAIGEAPRPVAWTSCKRLTLLGNHGAEHAMSEKVQEYLFSFWEVIDELLNSVLFLLIGLEVLVLAFEPAHAWIVLASIPIVLAARLISVALPITVLSIRQTFSSGSIPILTWGGLRGGVSVALALSLPQSDAKPVLLAATYAVVIFSILVQALTLERVAKHALRAMKWTPIWPARRDSNPRPPA